MAMNVWKAARVTAFLEGFSVLVVEIAGARALAPSFGASLKVWTAQITATLLFLALGYGLGGRWSKKGPWTLPIALWVGGVWLGLYPLLRLPILHSLASLGVSVGAFMAGAMLFGPVLLCLGAVSPLLIKRGADSGLDAGSAAGSIFFINTLGGLAGGWVTALVLIPHMPLRIALAACGALLLSLGSFWAWQRGSSKAVFVLPLALGMLSALGPRPLTALPHRPDYSPVLILENQQTQVGLLQILDLGDSRAILLDGITQGGMEIDTGASSYPFSEYLNFMAHRYHPQAQSALLLGLGCGVLARTMDQRGLQVQVVEIEPKVEKAARRFFGLPSRITVLKQDARAYLNRAEGLFDLIVLDAFAGENTAWYLTTRQGLQAAKAHLKPGGRMLINTVTTTDQQGEGLKRLEAGLLQVFGEAIVYVENKNSEGPQSLVNATLVAGEKLVATRQAYPSRPALRVAPNLATFQNLSRVARLGSVVDEDDFSKLDYLEADMRLMWRNLVRKSLGPEVLAD